MFGNFLYFIVALLIYTTYQPASGPELDPVYTFIVFASLLILFAGWTHLSFKAISARIPHTDFSHLEYRFNTAVHRYSVLAIFIYAVDIYLLNIGVWFQGFKLFKLFPTFEALFFLGLFIFYLCLVWGFAYEAYKRLYRTGVTRSEYILSNITFSLPILLPWFLLSISADILNILPFEMPKRLLFSTEGQIAYFLAFLVLIAIIGPGLIQRFWGCRPLRESGIRERIEALCRQTGMAYKEIMVWPLFGGRMITAGVMGLVRRFRYILVTPALLHYLEPEEIDAVIAHEIGHIKKKHLLFYLLFFAGYLIFAFSVLDFVAYTLLYAEALFGIMGREAGAYTTVTSISFSILMILTFLVYFRYIFGYFMRNFEREADIFAYGTVGDAAPLISTFEKIAAASGQPADRPNWHHFSIKERIDFLKACRSDASLMDRHRAKIRNSVLAYLLVLGLVAWAGVQVNFGAAGERINAGFLKTLVEKRLEERPRSAELNVMLGDLLYSEGKLAEAAASYEKTLSIDPDNVRALNNLAWLYATAEEVRVFQPKKALELARRAAGINPAPHVLDTLAQAYFVNDEIEKAVETEKKALSLSKDKASHYREQLEKFQEELNKGPLTEGETEGQ
jgi:Zn-dependent protease with chaperone function